MDIRKIRAEARDKVAQAQYPAKKLALLFCGGSVGLGFLITLINFLLGLKMESAGGLGGLDTRTTLSLIRTVVLIAGTVAMPYWSLGYIRATMDTARGSRTEPKTLLSGFRVIFPGLRMFLATALVVFAVMFVAAQAASILYMMSPASDGTMLLLEQMMENATVIDEAMTMEIVKLMWPLYVIMGLAVLALGIPVAYRLRLVEYQLMDGQEAALKNLAQSNRRMRGNCFAFFRLDLGFWWYYLLQGVASVLAYGDLLIPGDLAYWGFYVASALLQLALGWAFLPRVMTTYAVAYEKIIKKEQVI